MSLYAPDYYSSFLCIGEKCQHNCCIGWEIDIDKKTYNYYKSLKNEFGKKLLSNISNAENHYFMLDEKERCPFLNKNNLCDIIINLGEEHLCQICSDHPRFRNFFDTRTEIGLGLACEEAARIIISNTKKVNILPIESDNDINISEDDKVFFAFRQNLFDIIQNRNIEIKERIDLIRAKFNINKNTHKETAEFLLTLEYMDTSWKQKLSDILKFDKTKGFLSSIVLEQLLHYFIYRHLSDAQFDGRYKERIAFACFSAETIDLLSYCKFIKTGKFDISDLIEISRQYSSEIEYSEENTNKIINEFLKTRS